MNNNILNEKFLLSSVGTEINVGEKEVLLLQPTPKKAIKVELYCPSCKKERVFKCTKIGKAGYQIKDKSFDSLVLSRNDVLLIYDFSCEFNHCFRVGLETLGKGKLVKFGQFPDPTLLSKTINDAIFEMLKPNEKKYYLLAIKSHNNNLNIASFVYLRRVFESLIDNAKAKSTADFSGKKTKETIKILVNEGYLNEILEDNGYNVLYSLLSDGVHNLSEKECGEQFELLKGAIEIILEEESYKLKLKKRKEKIGNSLSNENSNKIAK